MFINVQFVETEQEIIIDSFESGEVLDIEFSEIEACIDVVFGEVQEIEKYIPRATATTRLPSITPQ